MDITTECENCSFESPWLFDDCMSKVSICISMDRVVSRQSKDPAVKLVISEIQKELTRFRWIAVGSVNIEIAWYLDAVRRQETNKIGDLDNVTKPILDALVGPNGLMVDDSQVKSIFTCWRMRNLARPDDAVVLEVAFNNEYAFPKENLMFIQYSGPMCYTANLSFEQEDSIVSSLVGVYMRRIQRRIGRLSYSQMLIQSDGDFHKSRLNAWQSKVISLDAFLAKCHEARISPWSVLRSRARNPSSQRT